MIVADTSAFVAIFKREEPADRLRERIGLASKVLVPAICLVEMALLRRVDAQLLPWATQLFKTPPYEVVAPTRGEIELAVDAANKFGKGGGHPAQLNFGDCIVYGVARLRRLPLLYTGNDFAKTDLQSA